MKRFNTKHKNLNQGHPTSDITTNVQNGAPLHEHKTGDVNYIHQSPHQQQSTVCQSRPQSDAVSVVLSKL